MRLPRIRPGIPGLYGAGFHADRYNGTIRERLGIEWNGSGCVDARDFRRGDKRFFWP